MKRTIMTFVLVILTSFSFWANEISPFIKVGTIQGSMSDTYGRVLLALNQEKFNVLGTYNPKGTGQLKVIVFTRNDIKYTVVKVADRGALAAAMKIGLLKKGDKIVISYVNPEYIFRAYLGDSYDTYKDTFDKFQNDLKTAMQNLGNDFTPFGGKVSEKSLGNYRYKFSMPRFSDPVVLAEYDDFYTMYNHIIKNLKTNDYGAKLVYKIVYSDKEIAVIGIGLLGNLTESEAYFLNKIGETHLAALPYEIILQNHKVTMLDGKYRFALFWPDLSLRTFMNIMTTPKHIKKTFKKITSDSNMGL